MKKKLLLTLLLCFLLALISSCKGAKADVNSDLSKHIEFQSVSGFYQGKAYTVDLPYLINEPYSADINSANENVDRFADLIEKSSKESGYMVEASCFLTEEDLISIRISGKNDQGQHPDESIWVTNYNIPRHQVESIASLDFPHSENYRAWLQLHLNEYYKKAENGNVRIYNFDLPYIYYDEDLKLMAVATFTKLYDGGTRQAFFAEIDISQGPEPYFTEAELSRIDDIIYNGYDSLTLSDLLENINDEYGIVLSYFDVESDKHESQLFALGQSAPTFPKIFDSLDLKVSFEENQLSAGDYTKVYSFFDAAGYKRFVLKTQYWGEKDWKAGFEKVIYVGTDYVSDASTGSIRGYIWMDEKELMTIYPHDLYVSDKVNLDAHAVINEIKPSKAYIYKDPNDYSNRDLVYVVKNEAVISMDVASSYEYSRYDTAFKLSKPLSSLNNKPSALVVKTILSYKGEFDVFDVLPDYVGGNMLEGEDRLIKVDINIPQVESKVPDSAKINEMIANFDPYIRRVAEGLNKGNLRVLAESDLLGYVAMDYNVYNYKDVAALVVKSEGYLFEAGGGTGHLIIYYDCDTGNIITAREYLKKCGISEDNLLKLCAEKEYFPSTSWYQAVNTAYDVLFAVDDKGKIILYTAFGD